MIDELELHIASLRRYAWVLCGNHADADDLVQESLVKAIATAHTFRRSGNLRAWLFSILHNTFVSQRRHFARRARASRFIDSALKEAEVPANQEKYVEVSQIRCRC